MNRKFISNSNYVLRKILNSEDYSEILKDLIEAILEINIKEIKLNPAIKEKSFGIADARITTDENEEINIGIQFIDGIYVQTKMLMYYAQIHYNQLKYDNKREFVKTITINLLDFKYFPSQEYTKIIKTKTSKINVKLEELELHIIELPKFKIIDENNMTKKEQWLTYLKGGKEKTIKTIKNNNYNIELLDRLLKKYWIEEKI